MLILNDDASDELPTQEKVLEFLWNMANDDGVDCEDRIFAAQVLLRHHTGYQP